MTEAATTPKLLSPAELVIARLSVREISFELRLTPSAIYLWRDRPPGNVPSSHHKKLLALAERLNVPLSADELINGGVE